MAAPGLRRTAPTVVTFDNVSKRFTLRRDKHTTLRGQLARFFRPGSQQETESFWALRDVSFAIQKGETIGLIGHNGSGKSTTLKLMTRILEPTHGNISVNGRVSALLELGSGFHPDLTGRENIYLNGSLLGQSHADMRRKIDEIIAFSEIEDFIDTPVKHYSSGMYMRLAFAIAVNVDPDILLTDEVLAVGDDAFQRKCLDRIYRFKRQGKTILFVSHALGVIQNMCDRVLWFDHGVLKQDGDPVRVVDDYLKVANELNRQRIKEERRRESERQGTSNNNTDTDEEYDDPQRWGTREIEIVQVELLDRQRNQREIFHTGETLIIRMHYRARKPIDLPVFGVAIYHQNGLHINGPNTRFSDYPIDTVEGTGTLDYIIDEIPLLEGEYMVSTVAYDHSMTHAYDHHDRKYFFRVEATTMRERFGTLYIPSTWHWKPREGNKNW